MESYLVVIMHLKMVVLVMLWFGRNGHHSAKFTLGQWRVANSCLPSNKIVDYSVEHAMIIEVYVSTQLHHLWSDLRTYVWLMPKAMQEKKNIGAIGRQGVVVLPPVWLMSKATPEERRRRWRPRSCGRRLDDRLLIAGELHPSCLSGSSVELQSCCLLAFNLVLAYYSLCGSSVYMHVLKLASFYGELTCRRGRALPCGLLQLVVDGCLSLLSSPLPARRHDHVDAAPWRSEPAEVL